MTILNLSKDIKGFNTYLRAPCELKYSITLTSAGGEKTLTVPNTSPKWQVIFSPAPGSSAWVAINGTAAVPAGATFAATTSELNPVGYELNAGDVIHVIVEDISASFGVSLYAVQ